MRATAMITGTGLVTPLGSSVADTWSALLAGHCIHDHVAIPSSENDSPLVSQLAIKAADQAIEQAEWARSANDAAVICCTSKGAVQSWIAGNSATASFGLSDLSTTVARHFGFVDDPRLTLSAACAGGLHALIRAVMMIQTGEATRVLIVASEASVHPLFLGSFQRLGVLPPKDELCRPFDVNRKGFLMSDAAAAVCIEACLQCDTGLRPVHGAPEVEKPDQNPTTPQPRVIIEQFAMGGDATHLTGSDPDGRVLRHLLRQTLAHAPVDLIHAHGTGTIANDQTELSAIESSLGDSTPFLFSHKGAIGHTLGASGLVAVVISWMCHRIGMVPANINTNTALPTKKLRISQQIERCDINRSIVIAAGFGGPAAVVALRSAGGIGIPPMDTIKPSP